LTGKDFVHALRHPDALACVEAVLSGKLASEAVVSLPGPGRVTYKMSCMRVEGIDGMDADAVISLKDISHILEAEQMRSDFVANVSHELRSPLTALSGGIETLKGAARNDPAARERFLDIMEREAARMDRLVGDLLSLSRVEVKGNIRPSARVDAIAVVERVVATFEAQSVAEKKPIRLTKPAGEMMVSGDEDELTQVFQNLIDNALKYSRDESEVELEVSQREKFAGMSGPVVMVEIKDQGEGIPAEHIPRLTERFYRVDRSRSREKGGTGLGLAIVKHILYRHRGRMLVESEIGAGSTFTVCLPLDPVEQHEPVS